MNEGKIENVYRSVEVDGPFDISSNITNLKTQREMENNALESFKDDGSSFFKVLKNSINQVNTHQQQADVAISNLVSGRTKNIHETMLAVERADASLKMLMQVRNKILDTYREIMRMQV